MKRFFGGVLFVLAGIWIIMACFKVVLAVTGYIDFNGRGPGDHIFSAFIQVLFAAGAIWVAKRFWKRPDIVVDLTEPGT